MPKTWGWSEENVSLTALRDRQYQPSAGIDIPDRTGINQNVMTNGGLRLSFFTPTRTLTVSSFTMLCITAGVDTGAGSTVRKMGLYTVNAAYTQVTCVARSANDTNLGNANDSRIVKQFTQNDTGYASSYTLVAGTTYAVGALFYNTGGTFVSPTMVMWNTQSSLANSNQSHLPMLVANVGSTPSPQTDITNTPVTVGDKSSSYGIYMRLT